MSSTPVLAALDSLFGLPAHPLVVHAAVVLIPLAAIGVCHRRCITKQHIVPIDGSKCVMCLEPAEPDREGIMRELHERIVREVRDGQCSRYMLRRFGEECHQAIRARRNGIELRLEFFPDVIADIVADYALPA